MIFSLTNGMTNPVSIADPEAKQTLLVLVASAPEVLEKVMQQAPDVLH